MRSNEQTASDSSYKSRTHALSVHAMVITCAHFDIVLLRIFAVYCLAKVESELCGLSEEERLDFLEALGVSEEETGLKVRNLVPVLIPM